MILKYSKMLLENKQRAVSFAVLFSVFPFAAWLSVALVSLVTLRRGVRPGFEVLIPALVIHSVPLMMILPVGSALINAVITYIPCYCAALALRYTLSWQSVFASFLALALSLSMLIQCLAPGFIIGQFDQFKNIMASYQEYEQVLESSLSGISSWNLAQLFFGIQMLSVVVSALISLVFARSIQAKLFMPGGLKAELVHFRSGRVTFLILIGIALGAYYELALALNLLPLILSYFLLSGLSLLYFVIAPKWRIRALALLLLLVVLQPILVVFAYIVLGSLDSLFNFRLYLPGRARESI